MDRVEWHAIPPEEAARTLGSEPSLGLTSAEAEARLARHGRNELVQKQSAGPLKIFLNQFRNILMVVLLVAVVLSVAIGEIEDSAVIAVIVLFCAFLGFVQEYRAERSLDALKKLLSPAVTTLRDGREVEVESVLLVPGDILVLEAGDKVPADARLMEASSVQCDEASLTGESDTVEKSVQVLPPETRLGERRNMLFAGTSLTHGRCRAIVTATGMDTELGGIASQVMAVDTSKTPLEVRTAEIGRWLGLGSLAVCFLVAGISIARQAVVSNLSLEFVLTMVMFSVSLAVAAVPEALAAIVTGALAVGMRRMAREHALVRKLSAVETLGSTTVICTDKTGTLTRGEMTVRQLWTAGGSMTISGVGYAPEGGFSPEPDETVRQLLLAGALCGDSGLTQDAGAWSIKGDPTEAALVVAAAKAGLDRDALLAKSPRCGGIPFSSERKRMSSLHRMDGRVTAFVKGAPEVVLALCDRIAGPGGLQPLSDEVVQTCRAEAETMAGEALRVLGLAHKELPGECERGEPAEEELESGLVFLGLAGMMDPPRGEVLEAVRTCFKVGIRPVMITGDHKLTALAVARELEIYREGDQVLTGEELERMDEAALEAVVDRVSVYARVSPIDKLKIVKAWKRRGEIVAMTGDGVNDAPALKHADIGVAMGITGTEVTREAADMILTDDNFASIVKAVELGRWIYDNIKKYLTYLLRCNVTEVAVIAGVVLVLGPKYLPLLPAAILYINLATDGLPAFALGLSPPDPDIMLRPPRDPGESVFSREVLLLVGLALVVEIPFFFLLFFLNRHDLVRARTEMFFLFIVTEIVIALNFRSMRHSVFRAPPHGWLLLAVASEIVMVAALFYLPAIRQAFGIGLPTLASLGRIMAFGLVVCASIEGMKAFLRRHDPIPTAADNTKQ